MLTFLTPIYGAATWRMQLNSDMMVTHRLTISTKLWLKKFFLPSLLYIG